MSCSGAHGGTLPYADYSGRLLVDKYLPEAPTLLMAAQAQMFPEVQGRTVVLTEREIREFVSNGWLLTTATFDESSLEATSYDVRVGARGIIGGQGAEIDLSRDPLIIGPGAYAGIISLEKVKLPKNVFAQVGSKRKFSYEGLILLTGSIVDPGYEGHLLFGLYNASSKKVVLPARTKVCTLVFYQMDREGKPVSPDPALLNGRFPNDFLSRVANMEVLPWAQISEEVGKIKALANEVLDLKARYNDVLEPIKVLTSNVEKVNADVGLLAKEIKSLSGNIDRVEGVTTENARQINEVVSSIRLLTGETSRIAGMAGTHDTELREMGKKFSVFSTIIYIIGAVLLLVIGGWIQRYIFSEKSGTQSPVQQGAPAAMPAPAQTSLPQPIPNQPPAAVPSQPAPARPGQAPTPKPKP